jgi:hypothetical protein
MTYRLGIEVGPTTTSWAVVPHPAPPGSTAVGATVASVVAVSTDGRLVAGPEVPTASAMRAIAADFAGRLGAVEPVMLGGTPYGIEALVGQLIASVLRAVHRQQGEWPELLALAHVDELDEYRRSLLAEGARLAGVPLTSVVLVAASRAAAAFERSGVVAPAPLGIAVGATLADQDMTRPPPVGGAAGGVIAGAVGGTIGGIAATAAGAGAAGDATLAAGAYGGTSLATGTAYSGTPLAGSGAGYGGTPLASPGGAYGGTPLAPSGTGYGGTPLDPPDVAAANHTGGGTQAKRLRGLRRLGPRRFPIVAGATAATALAVAAGAFALRDDPAPDAAVAVATTVPVTVPVLETRPAVTSAPTSPPAVTPTTVPATEPPTTVPTPSQCAIGDWQVRADVFAANIAAQGDSNGLQIESVTGDASAVISADGHFVFTYHQLTVTARAPEGDVLISIMFDGTVDSLATFADDGTATITTSTASGTLTTSVTAGGETQAPSTTPLGDEFSGTTTYTCVGDVLEFQAVNDGGSIPFDRIVVAP